MGKAAGGGYTDQPLSEVSRSSAEIADRTASTIRSVGLEYPGHTRQHPVGVRPRLVGRLSAGMSLSQSLRDAEVNLH